MKRNTKKIEILVGLFFIVGVVSLIYVTIAVNKNNFNQNRETLEVHFKNISGLNVGDKVFFRGLEIGNVANLELTEDASEVKAILKVDKKPSFYNNYNISVEANLFGNQSLALNQGTQDTGNYQGVLYGQSRLDAFKAVGTLATTLQNDRDNIASKFTDAKTLDKVINIVDNFNDASNDLKAMVADIKMGKGSLGQIIAKDDISNKITKLLDTWNNSGETLTASVNKAGSFIDDMKNKNGLIGKLVYDESFASKFDKIATNLESSTENIDLFSKSLTNKNSTIYKLFNDNEELYSKVNTFLTNLNNKDNSLNRLLADDGKIYSKIDEIAENIANFSKSINNPNTTIGALATSKDLYTKLDKLLSSGSKVFDDVSRAIDDIREQTPLSTATSIFSGAF